MIVFEKPDETISYPDPSNLCLTDNEAMTRYLIRDFTSKFPSFRDRAGLDAITWMKLDAVPTTGDMKSSYSETATAAGLDLVMTWEQLR